jgi:HD-like signal output (HDOD) protein
LPNHLEPDVERAALFQCAVDFGESGLARLAAAVCSADDHPVVIPKDRDSSELNAAYSLRGGKPIRPNKAEEDRIAQIVKMCRAVDQQFEALPLEYKPVDEILDEVQSFGVLEGFDGELVQYIRQFRCGSTARGRLPVQAVIAQQVLRTLGMKQECEVEELVKLAGQDAVLAGSVIQVANSAFYGGETRLSRIGDAIRYLGTVATREIMLAAVMRPLFASAGLLRLWKHSIQMAQLCSVLAERSGIMDPDEAMLLGLVHDIGSLAIQTSSSVVLERYNRLVENGCPSAYVESLLWGCDHGELGSQVLLEWNFPDRIVEAVRFHHQPERSESPIASLLFLAEVWCGLGEDTASILRTQLSSKQTGITMESLATSLVGKGGALDLLRSAA